MSQTSGVLFSFGSFQNQEVEQYTRCFSEARETAMERLTMQMYDALADGTVGMTVSHDIEHIEYESNNRSTRDLLINFEAIGTAVEYLPSLATTRVASPLLVLNLATGKTSAIEVAVE